MKQALILLALIGLFVGTARADIVQGRVVDSETKEPLPDASVTFTQYSDYGYSMHSMKADSLGAFSFSADGKGTIEASMLGYYSKRKNVLAFSDSQKDTINVGDIELKMSPQMLKMVQVKGHARRFTVRGDTIIFNPEAFHLQEGARLDELIRKLPGVEVNNDGSMSWNGKPIRLTMDGEGMMGGDDLIKQLPAEAVQNIKAYNKASEFSERTKKDDGTEDMVLDLTIKPGFLDRWYGDVTAGYQTDKYYESQLSMNRLSKSDPVLVFADANNVDKRHRRTMNGGFSTWGNGFGKEEGASVGYQHKWQRKEGTQEMKSQYSFSGGVAHDDDRNINGDETENYFPNTSLSRITSENYHRFHQLHPTFNADLRWARDSLNTYLLSASVEHDTHRSHSRETTEQSEAAVQGDLQSPSVPYAATLSQFTASRTEGHRTAFNTTAGWNHYIKDGSLGASVKLNYSDTKDESQTERTVTSHLQTLASSHLSQSSSSPSTSFSTEAEGHHARWLTKKWMMEMQYTFRYNRNRNDCAFLANGEADSANSFRDRYSSNSHSFRAKQTINLTPVQLMPIVIVNWRRESQDYQRGLLDTTAVRHSFLVEPSLRATWKVTKTVGFELNYSFRTSRPRILSTIGYRDLTNPLYITEGNPNLKDSHIHDVSLNYNMVIARTQTSLSFTASHQNIDRDEESAISYDPATGVYTSRPENVEGSSSWNFRLNADQSIGDNIRLQNDFRLNTSRHYGYLTQMAPSNLPQLGEASTTEPGAATSPSWGRQEGASLNRQSNFNPREKLKISYDKDWLKSSIFAEINADRLRFTASPEQNTTLWNNNFGLEAEATYGNFVFETSLTERTRRGYAAAPMNSNLLLWDGSVTWKILKNKARLKLEFKDILNNEDGYWCQQSAYQRVTSWSDFRHHYVGLSFTYHLDAKKKEL